MIAPGGAAAPAPDPLTMIQPGRRPREVSWGGPWPDGTGLAGLVRM